LSPTGRASFRGARPILATAPRRSRPLRRRSRGDGGQKATTAMKGRGDNREHRAGAAFAI